MRALRRRKPTRRYEDDLISRRTFSHLSERQSYFSFSVGLFKGSRLFRLWEKYVRFFRRFRFVTTAVRLLPWILLLISTNTLLYAAVALAVFLIPVFLIAVFSLAASAPLRYREVNARMAERLFGKKIYVVFPQRREFARGAFWLANVLDLASRRDACVIVVSPYFLSAKGPGGKRFYFNLRAEKSNVYLVRRHYFFSLRQHVLLPLIKQLIFIY